MDTDGGMSVEAAGPTEQAGEVHGGWSGQGGGGGDGGSDPTSTAALDGAAEPSTFGHTHQAYSVFVFPQQPQALYRVTQEYAGTTGSAQHQTSGLAPGIHLHNIALSAPTAVQDALFFCAALSSTCTHGNFLKGVKWSPDGACLLTASDDCWWVRAWLTLWRARNGRAGASGATYRHMFEYHIRHFVMGIHTRSYVGSRARRVWRSGYSRCCPQAFTRHGCGAACCARVLRPPVWGPATLLQPRPVHASRH